MNASHTVDEVNYQSLKNDGWSVFSPLASECLSYFGSGDAKNLNTRYLIVLCGKNEKEKAMILSTAATAEHFATQLQNIHNKLDVNHRFVHISRCVGRKETLESFLRDAREIKNNDSSAKNVEVTETTAISQFKALVADAIESGASDIHWWVDSISGRIALRIDGEMKKEKGLNKVESREMLSAVLQQYAPGFRGYESDSRQINLPIDIEVDVRNPDTGIKVKEGVRLRLNRTGSSDRLGYKATLRIQRRQRKHSDLSSLSYEKSMQEQLKGILNEPYGIFIGTGKVGSGKSTLIKALMEGIPYTKSGLSIEDPIEFDYEHPNIHAIQVDNKDEASTLEALLHASLRQDPDFINVSEIRTPEVAEDVLGHARVGCVMLSTLHTNDSITSFDRLCELGISPKELSNTDLFLGIMSQRLMKNMCSRCSSPVEKHGRTVFIRNKEGCEHCNSGYVDGRIAVAELLVPDEDDARFIENKAWLEWRKYLLSKGFKTQALRALELSTERKVCYNDCADSVPFFKKVDVHLEHYQSPSLEKAAGEEVLNEQA